VHKSLHCTRLSLFEGALLGVALAVTGATADGFGGLRLEPSRRRIGPRWTSASRSIDETNDVMSSSDRDARAVAVGVRAERGHP